jgi:hypothetical protein
MAMKDEYKLKVQDGNPIKAAVEKAISKRLDQMADKEEGASELAKVDREKTETIKPSDGDFYDKVAAAACRLKIARKVRAFKK